MNKVYKKSTLIILMILFMGSGKLLAQEAKLYSGIIYYLTKYVEWPASKQSGDFVISVVGDSGIVSHLETMAKLKKVGSRNIVVKKVASMSDTSGSHIVYLSENNIAQFSQAKNQSIGSNTLLVTAAPGYSSKGSMVNLILKGGKPAFEINETITASADLKVSSKLIALSK